MAKYKTKKQLIKEAEKMLKVIEGGGVSPEFIKTMERLAPALYHLAIAGIISEIMNDSLKKSGLFKEYEKKKKKKLHFL